MTLLKQSDPTLKFEVFLRLNRGGERLNAQEIRNVAYRGKLNDLIYDLADNQFLRDRLKIHSATSSAYREMADAEYVLRFFTLSERIDDFSGSLIYEMDRFMRDHQRDTDEQLAALRAQFESTLHLVEQIWGEDAFKRPEGDGWRDQTLAGMFDAQMIAAASLTTEARESAVEQRASIIDGTRDLFASDEFDKAVRTGTNTPARIRYRVYSVLNLLTEA